MVRGLRLARFFFLLQLHILRLFQTTDWCVIVRLRLWRCHFLQRVREVAGGGSGRVVRVFGGALSLLSRHHQVESVPWGTEMWQVCRWVIKEVRFTLRLLIIPCIYYLDECYHLNKKYLSWPVQLSLPCAVSSPLGLDDWSEEKVTSSVMSSGIEEEPATTAMHRE